MRLERYQQLFNQHQIPATFFVIGKDMDRAANVDQLTALKQAGHELANHTENHRYDFSRLDESEIAAEIQRCGDRLTEITSQPTAGFRAPGYTITDPVFAALKRQNYRYDSSVFPCPAYYAIKSSMIGFINLRGRTSHSVIDESSCTSRANNPVFCFKTILESRADFSFDRNPNRCNSNSDRPHALYRHKSHFGGSKNR